MEETNNNPNKGNFQKALIKVAHPDWSPEQIENEYQRLQQLDDDDGGCEMCSG